MANSQGNFLQGGGNSSQSSDSSDLQTQSEGSGVIYKKDGKTAYIVTNNHVIDGSDAIEVILKDGTKVEAKLIGADQWTDLAVLSIPADKVKTVATFGNSDDIKVGEPAIAIGSPLGTNFATSVTQGIVSAKDRSVAMDIDGDGVEDWDMTAIQTDAAINPGNSGGALINLAGQVIGINSMKISQDTVEGMGFAIPSNDVVKIINELQQNGKIVRPVLGVVLRDLSQISEQQQQSVLKLPEDVTEGVVITNVQKDSAAAKGGLEQYDTITEIDGQKITDSVSLRKVIYNLKVGDTVEVKFYRDGKLETAKVTMEAANSI
jgi:serine protease Do